MDNNNNKIKNQVALKYGGYATVVTAIIIAAAILLNVLVTFLGERYHISFDLTSEKINTMDEVNIDYIKNVERDVDVTICASEDGYLGEYLAYYAYNLYMAEDTTGYYEQTLNLIKDYPTYNDKINVIFSDPQDPDFAKITSKYPDEQFVYGDIIVESSFDLNGKEVSRYKVIHYDDIYDLKDESGLAEYGYGTYTVAGTNIETRLTSAIYYVTSEKIINAATLSGHCDTSFSTSLTDTLTMNSYNVSDIADPIINENSIPEDTDILILAGVMNDFTVEELNVINTFLENGETRGKGLMFFASTASPALPNLYTFLEEWGISVDSGLLFETDENYSYQNLSNMLMFNNSTEYTDGINTSSGIFIAGNNIPLDIVYENKGSKYTYSLLTTSDTVVCAPAGTSTEWQPDDSYAKGSYDTVILTRDTSYEENSDGNSSYVIAFSTTDFIASIWAQYPTVLNSDLALNLANLSGDIDNDITFMIKTISSEDFAEQVNGSTKAAMLVIFVILLPVASLVACVLIYIRRKNR